MAETNGTEYQFVPVVPSGGYVIYNGDGTIMCIMPDGSIIYYDQFGNVISKYP